MTPEDVRIVDESPELFKDVFHVEINSKNPELYEQCRLSLATVELVKIGTKIVNKFCDS